MACIVTLGIDPASHALLDALRRRHFPPARNFLAAHVTLFHALPDEREPDLRDALAALARTTPPFAVQVAGVRFLGRGVALDVHAPALLALRRALADAFAADLTPQDAQPYRPHVTVQNKVEPTVARALRDELASTWQPRDARAESLLLSRYAGGPWTPLAEFRLGGHA